LEFADRGFVRAADFPKVSNFIYLDGLAYLSSTKIDNGDLSFHVQNEPLLVDEQDFFTYQSVRFTSKSSFKLVSAAYNDETQSIKNINKERAKEIKKRVRHLLNQGVKCQLT